jgi:hypothetical protein
MSRLSSMRVGGAIQSRVGSCPSYLLSSLPAARKCPMLVMHEPIKTSSILRPCTSLSSLASSGSLGAQRIGSFISFRLMWTSAAYVAPLSACSKGYEERGQASLKVVDSYLEENGVSQPCLHLRNASADGTLVAVALRNHPLQHGHIRGQVLNDGFLV